MAESGGVEGFRQSRASITENEDRLSALPDSLIHHILSLLPSTNQAIQTGILSKRWRNQWTFVSNLIFDLSGMFSDDSLENIPLASSTISGILDQTLSLHRCSKVHKFHIITNQLYQHGHDPSYEDKIRFVVTKQPEELILNFSRNSEFPLPEIFFCQPFLVKLQLFGCSIMHIGVLNWKSLKDLSIESCYCTDEVIRAIVSGSPLLQSFEINYCLYGLFRLVIASASLKTLAVIKLDCYVDILCPNLVQFYGCSFQMGLPNFGWSDMVLKFFLSDTPSLESLKLKNFKLSNIQITSKILKKLAFGDQISHEIAISCPHLEELHLSGYLETISLMNLSSSVSASLDLCYSGESQETSVKQILESVQHLNELGLKSYFIQTLSALEMAGASHPLLNCKTLVVKSSRYDPIPSLQHVSGVIYALHCSPMLERLIINLRRDKDISDIWCRGLSTLDYSGENYWNSYGARFSSLVSHLLTVEIIGFSQKEHNPKLVLDFVEFVLKNAKLLEKVIIVLKDCGADFRFEVSQKLLSFPRCSAATVELLCSK